MTNESFDNLLSSKSSHIIILSASWCAPCKVLASTVSRVISSHPELSGKITKVDIDEDQDLALRYSVMSVPTVLYVKNGEVEISKGLQSESSLLDWFK